MPTQDLQQPVAFPGCPSCPYLQAGTATECYTCARATFTVASNPCPVCTREMADPDGTCGNPLCNDSRRHIERVEAIAVKTGPLDAKIQLLKYGGKIGWATIFGRVLLGHLQANHRPDEFDLIIANPTFIGPGSETLVHHTELVVEAAAQQDVHGLWHFDVGSPRALVKTGPTTKSAGCSYAGKKAAADALVDVLDIPETGRTTGARILVYDDISTTLLQLDRVAKVLYERGHAAHVEGIVLARTPWRR